MSFSFLLSHPCNIGVHLSEYLSSFSQFFFSHYELLEGRKFDGTQLYLQALALDLSTAVSQYMNASHVFVIE